MEQEKESSASLNFSFKSLVIIILLAIGVYLLVPHLVGLPEVGKLIVRVKKIYLLLALLFEIISYCGAAWLLGIILSRLGHNLPFKDRFRIGSIAAFAIHFFPIGSVGEGAIDYYFLKKRDVNTGSVLLMLVLRTIFTYAAFLCVFLVGLILVPTYPNFRFSPRIVSFAVFALIMAGVFYLFFLYRNKEIFRKRWNGFLKFANKILGKTSKKTISKAKSNEIFDDIYKGIGLFGNKKRSSVWAILAGLTYWLGDITCFYFVFLSLGYQIHAGALIFGYGVATLAGLISFIPGGLGVTEGSMGLIYSGLGVPTTLAVTAILLFRVFSFWIWIPLGLLSYLTLKKETREDV